ncbi:MAG TPA: electron transfer flavoprotein beta subunit/FixA family protein [Desulfobacteraceae bacterium]|nr:electron transfer flavoprotein beta subunit/FixA family protein [Desulfobacteraceae bacterium]
MKIFVCVKHVPDTAARVSIRGAADYDAGNKYVMNPHDEYALEQALAIKRERVDTELTAVSLGKSDAEKTLRTALALGADRAVLVETEVPFPGPGLTAAGLAAVIRSGPPPDLVLTGSRSVDTEAMQTPYRLAALLGLPVVTEITAFEMNGKNLKLQREIGNGAIEEVELSLPCVVGAARGLNVPRSPTLPALMQARKKPVEKIPLDSGMEHRAEGFHVVRIEVVNDERHAEIITGTTREAAGILARIIKSASGNGPSELNIK